MITRTPPDSCVADFSSLVTVSNHDIARHLVEIADLLESQRANLFRVQAYRDAACTVEETPVSIQEVFEQEGLPGLISLPGIGESIAVVIEQRVCRGHSLLLDRLRGEAAVERTFATVPGIGPELAARIHEQLGIDTLEELEVAAHNGTLQNVKGMGRRRVLAVQESLAGRFRHRPHDAESLFHLEPAAEDDAGVVSIGELLSIDDEYRQRAAEGSLTRIAPRRFNPNHERWLPILHTERRGEHFTALFSNTARAHQLGRTRDWVVIHRDEHGEGQWTVVTQHRGTLNGKRVVRGREIECARFYAATKTGTTSRLPASVSRKPR